MLRPHNKDWMRHWHSQFRHSRMLLAGIQGESDWTPD